MAKETRDNFSELTKRTLRQRAAERCSNPNCRDSTSGPHTDPDKSINIGVAAHITAASPGGPRYDPTLSPAQRSATENGIWVCQKCGKTIDSDETRWSVQELRDWKEQAEQDALTDITGRRSHTPPAPRPLQLPARDPKFTARHVQIQEALESISSGSQVTLVGPGGIGKSAIAAEIIWRISSPDHPTETFPDGIIYYSFYGQPELDLALEHICRSLHYDPVPSPRSAAQRALSGKQILLILDGTEVTQGVEDIIDLGDQSGCLSE